MPDFVLVVLQLRERWWSVRDAKGAACLASFRNETAEEEGALQAARAAGPDAGAGGQDPTLPGGEGLGYQYFWRLVGSVVGVTVLILLRLGLFKTLF